MELTLAAALVSAAALCLTAVAAEGAAAWAFGRGWVFPHTSTAFMAAVGDLIIGRPAHAFTAAQRTMLPVASTIYWVIGAAEILLIAALIAAGVALWRVAGPGPAGYATRADVEAALGLYHLRKRRSEIRPDLYQPPRRRRRTITATPAGWDQTPWDTTGAQRHAEGGYEGAQPWGRQA